MSFARAPFDTRTGYYWRKNAKRPLGFKPFKMELRRLKVGPPNIRAIANSSAANRNRPITLAGSKKG